MSRSVGLALAVVFAAASAAPAAAATVNATIGDRCWLREYPDTTTCGYYGDLNGDLGVGYTNFGDSISFFSADLSVVPQNATVTRATLRFDNAAPMTSTVHLGRVTGGLDWDNTNWAAFDVGNIDTTVSFVPGTTPTREVDITHAVREWLADGHTQPFLGAHAQGASDHTFLDDLEIELEYHTACPSNPYAAASVTSESVVHDWNQQLLTRFRDVLDPSTPEIRRSPTWTSRAAAMMNVAIFDTFNSVYFAKLESLATGTPTSEALCGWESYLTLADTPANTNANLAAGYAAKATLTALYPDKSTEITAAFNTIHGNPSHDATASALGNHVATQVINARSSDGSGAAMSYTPASTTPGAWRPSVVGSAPSTCPGAVTPQWGSVTPFAMSSGSQFRPPLPGGFTNYSDLLASSLYANNVIEVRNKGRYTGSTRTVNEEEAAWFWANDVNGTYKPPGQLLQHTKELIATQPAAHSSGDPLEFFRRWSRQGIRVARLYAAVSLAMADSGIAAWDAKYNTAIDLWRPIEAIRNATGGLAVAFQNTWEPLSRTITGVQFSPCFPAWISGHATFGGTWSRVMENEFQYADYHNNPFPLTLSTEDPHSVQNNDLHRTFSSFAAAGEENAESRIWLGVHYRIDAEGGLATGRAVADKVTLDRLRPAKTCASWGCATAIP